MELESQWILEVLRRWLSGRTDALAVADDLNAEQLGDLLDRNRLLPLFHTLPIACPPSPEWTRFRERASETYQCSLVIALRQLSAANRLMKDLQKAGIPCLALRGPFLALDLYGDPAVRASTDIDILVPRGDRLNAWKTCRAAGYRSLDWECPLWPLDGHRIHWRMQRPGNDVVCELHWTVEPVYGVMTLAYHRLFDRVSQESWGRFTWPQPCPDDLLLLLALHTGRHIEDAQRLNPLPLRSGADALARGALFRWVDMALLLRRHGGRIAWDWVSECMADRRLCRGMVINLRGVADWLGMKLPPEAMTRLAEWEQAMDAQCPSRAMQHAQQRWERGAGSAVGLGETSIEDVLYFLFPHRLFFASHRGPGLWLRRTGHFVAATARLVPAFLSWFVFTGVTLMRRWWRASFRSVNGETVTVAGQS